jgi:hypothetical protein
MLEMERYLVGRQAFPHGKVWTFKCPTCSKLFEYDEPGEPLCTGPNETTDDHDTTAMLLLSVRTVEGREKFAPPEVAQRRSTGALFVPGHGLRGDA